MIEVDLQKLVDLREQARLSISDVALRLGYKTPTGYWLLEHGERKVSVEHLYLLAILYGTRMEDLLIELPSSDSG
jgi:transcriptional regulator with XRE-family HTH domain